MRIPGWFDWPWRLGARRLCAETLIPVGVAAAAGIAVGLILPPHWTAAGLPYLRGYGKNVESAAVVAALAAGAATQLFVGSRRGFRVCALLAGLGFALAVACCQVVALLSGWPQLLAIAGIATLLGSSAASGGESRRAGIGPIPAPFAGALMAGLVTGVVLLAFAVTVGPQLLSIDVFHHGETLSTAVDLLRGGRPFETMLWPHGVEDTGLTALWILACGKVGTSPLALARATRCALGIVSTYLLTRQLLGRRRAALSACLAAALAPLLFDEPHSTVATQALEQLGALVFVALVCGAVAAPRRHPFAAGAGCALAYLFRIETGVYATLAALAVIAYRAIGETRRDESGAATSGELAASSPGTACGATAGGELGASSRTSGAGGNGGATSPAWAAARALGAQFLRFAAGTALVLLSARLILGWPGAAWYAYTLGDLPRYHRDAVGIPLPWPRRGVVLSPGELAWLATTLSRLLLALLLLVQALRAVLARRRRHPSGEGVPVTQLLFIALFAALTIKSGLDRSDPGHILQWTALPLLAAAGLAVTAWGNRRSWSPNRVMAAFLILFLLLDFGSLGLRLPALRHAAAVTGAAREHWRRLVAHLSPNPPVGACGDRMFTPDETRIGDNGRFIAEECAVEGLLRTHGVRRLVVADSAAWYDVRFHMLPATRYFALQRAYTPPRQFDLIAALRARPAQALLRPRGYNAMWDFDLPDAVRVPVADAYLRGRREGVAPTPTPLGDFFFWDEPAAPTVPPALAAPAVPRPAAATDRAVARIELSAELVAYQPASGVLFATGWAADAAGQPLAALAVRDLPPGITANLEYGLDRGSAAAAAAGISPHTGWDLVCRGWRELPGRRALALAAKTAAGATAGVELDLTTARLLGPLSGAEWDGLGAAIDRAAALGRADRSAARDRSTGAHAH